MRFQLERKIGQCCAKENWQYALTNVVIHRRDEGNAALIATDGKILAIVPQTLEACAADAPTTAIIPGDAFMKAPARVTITDEKVLTLPRRAKAELSFERDLHAAQFPDVSRLVNDVSDCSAIVHLDAKRLARLAEAISSDGAVHLVIEPGANAITVIGDEGVGVQALMKSDGDLLEQRAAARDTVQRYRAMLPVGPIRQLAAEDLAPSTETAPAEMAA